MFEELFTSVELGNITLPNRIVMAPMTRGRADDNCVPGKKIIEHYQQRADAGLIITEATHISEQGRGWVGAPGIHTAEQVAGWQKVTRAVHERNGHIYLQLWHMGRASHSDFHPGELSVSATATALEGEISTPIGRKAHETPRALETSEISGIVEQYANATRLAKEAGFDGVEIHAANGYLIDQFLRNGCNQRTDQYGGTIENRCRFMLEVVTACVDSWDAANVGIRFSPTGDFQGMSDTDPLALFSFAVERLNPFKLAYIHTMEPLPGHMLAGPSPRVTPTLRKIYQGKLIVNGGFNAATGAQAIASGEADCVAYGMPYIANPDLTTRFRLGAELNEVNQETMYTHGEEGYNDYPAL